MGFIFVKKTTVTQNRVRANLEKVEAMTTWQRPKILKQLRGFFGLTSYYRRFVIHYAMIASLTELLKKNSFIWNDIATVGFENLKRAMMETPVLRLPDFYKIL